MDAFDLYYSNIKFSKKVWTSFRLGIYKDQQIHTKTGFQTIKLQDSQFAFHANQMPSNRKEQCELNYFAHATESYTSTVQ